jgi:hypothetical protein
MSRGSFFSGSNTVQRIMLIKKVIISIKEAVFAVKDETQHTRFLSRPLKERHVKIVFSIPLTRRLST